MPKTSKPVRKRRKATKRSTKATRRRRIRAKQLNQLARLPRTTVGAFADAVDVTSRPADTKASLAKRILASKRGKALTATGAILTAFALGFGGGGYVAKKRHSGTKKIVADKKQVEKIQVEKIEDCLKKTIDCSKYFKVDDRVELHNNEIGIVRSFLPKDDCVVVRKADGTVVNVKCKDLLGTNFMQKIVKTTHGEIWDVYYNKQTTIKNLTDRLKATHTKYRKSNLQLSLYGKILSDEDKAIEHHEANSFNLIVSKSKLSSFVVSVKTINNQNLEFWFHSREATIKTLKEEIKNAYPILKKSNLRIINGGLALKDDIKLNSVYNILKLTLITK
jgi:hypothetical protein